MGKENQNRDGTGTGTNGGCSFNFSKTLGKDNFLYKLIFKDKKC
jgi:hypothetical protein